MIIAIIKLHLPAFTHKNMPMRTLLILASSLLIQHAQAAHGFGPAVCIDGLVNKDTIRNVHLGQPLKLRICNDIQGLVEIVEFKMSRYGKGIDPIERSTSGDTLSPDMRVIIQQAPPASKLYFEYIRGRRTDGKIIILNSVELTKE